jgi:dihydroorotase
MRIVLTVLPLLAWSVATVMGQAYDLLLKGGRLIDPKNGISARRDVAIADGKVAEVAEQIASTKAKQTIDVSGLYVAPGFIDLHTHIVSGSGLKGTLPVEQNVCGQPHAAQRCDDGS